MVVLLENFSDVPFHGEAAGALLVVPMKFGIGVILAIPVSGDGVVILQSREDIFGVLFLYILNSKII